jgi:hypothetical protein
MRFFPGRKRLGTAVAASVALSSGLTLLSGAPAAATGIVTVQQKDGTVQNYAGAKITLVRGKELRVTSPDGKGTMIVDKAACSYDGPIERCLLSSVSLTQSGATKALDLQSGTIYVNLTGQRQQLPLSSVQLPPNGVEMTLKTQIGTYINLAGTIDGEVK